MQIYSNGCPTAEETGYSLMCSTILVDPIPLPSDVPTPTFQWFFGPNGNGTLPSGVTPSMTSSSMSSNPHGITYTSTLQFPPLYHSLHTGWYTCRIGAGILANSTFVTVNNKEQGRYIEYNNYIYNNRSFSAWSGLLVNSRFVKQL